MAAPYWIQALVDPSRVSGYLSLVGAARTYGYFFPVTAPGYAQPSDRDGFAPLSAAARAQVLASFDLASSFINLRFTPVSSPDVGPVIAVAMNNQTASAAYAYLPSLHPLGSDMYFNRALPENLALASGSPGALYLVHELGHALGLDHPFAGGGNDTGVFLTGSEDSSAWTVMSYTMSAAQFNIQYSPLDIAALQFIYGPSPSARAGHDTYSVIQSQPNFIWDGAGTDTLDLSGLTSSANVSLTPGYWGYIGAARASRITAAGQVTVNHGTVIENLLGGAGDDALFGNEVANRIVGGGGQDVLEGGAGNDSLEGGTGIDTAVFSGARSQYSLADLGGGSWRVTALSGSEGSDVLIGVEQVRFSDAVIALNAGVADPPSGGSGGATGGGGGTGGGTGGSGGTGGASGDVTPPSLVGSTPAADAKDVPLDQSIVLTFSEPVTRGTGFIAITYENGGSFDVYPVATSNRLSFSGNTVTIDPQVSFIPGFRYVLTVEPGAIRDAAGNAYAGLPALTFGTAAPPDTTPPILRITQPQANATAVPAKDNLVFVFTEEVQRGSGRIVLTNANGIEIESFDVATSSAVTLQGSILTLNPTKDLPYESVIRVSIPAGAVRDAAGNRFAGLTDLRFETEPPPDLIPPVLTAIKPSSGAVDVSRTATFEFSFSEPVKLGSGLIRVVDSAGQSVELFATTTVSQVGLPGSKFVLDPSVVLAYGTEYRIEIDPTFFTDRAGNRLESPPTYRFTTELRRIDGSPDNNLLNGLDMAEAMRGFAGHDRLQGNGGNDRLDGGDGDDTALYRGTKAEYRLSHDPVTRQLTVRDTTPNRDGTDTLLNIEALRFADATVLLLPNPEHARALGGLRALLGSQSSAADLKAALAAYANGSAAKWASAYLQPNESAFDLTSRVMGNLELAPVGAGGNVPLASHTALADALVQLFTVFADATSRAQIMLNLASLLGSLQADAAYGAAAREHLRDVDDAYITLVAVPNFI